MRCAGFRGVLLIVCFVLLVGCCSLFRVCCLSVFGSLLQFYVSDDVLLVVACVMCIVPCL